MCNALSAFPAHHRCTVDIWVTVGFLPSWISDYLQRAIFTCCPNKTARVYAKQIKRFLLYSFQIKTLITLQQVHSENSENPIQINTKEQILRLILFIFLLKKEEKKEILNNTRLSIQNEENGNNKRKCSHHVCKLVVCAHLLVHHSSSPLQPNPQKNDGEGIQESKWIYTQTYIQSVCSSRRKQEMKWQNDKGKI